MDELNEVLSSRQDAIHQKGFDLFNFSYSIPDEAKEGIADYSKMKVGVKQLEDAILELGVLR